jgi:hypothetical protein
MIIHDKVERFGETATVYDDTAFGFLTRPTFKGGPDQELGTSIAI